MPAPASIGLMDVGSLWMYGTVCNDVRALLDIGDATEVRSGVAMGVRNCVRLVWRGMQTCYLRMRRAAEKCHKQNDDITMSHDR